MEIKEVSLSSGLAHIGLRDQGVFLEGFRTDGTSNYHAVINYSGRTWAAALRFPAQGRSRVAFLSEKLAALATEHYLTPILASGIRLGPRLRLTFHGGSCFVSGSSTQAFFACSRGGTALRLVDEVTGREKVYSAFQYPEKLRPDVREYVRGYDGPFYLSPGAPSWNTLEEIPELADASAQALAALQLRTGSGSAVPVDRAWEALEGLIQKLREAAALWDPLPGSKEHYSLKEALARWKAREDSEREDVVRCERFLRTEVGRGVIDAAVRKLETEEGATPWLSGFSHGDCHAGNVVVVRYGYSFDGEAPGVDRVFLNEIFDRDPSISAVQVVVDPSGDSIVHRAVQDPEGDMTGVVARRNPHDDLFLIDLDNGTGYPGTERVIHLKDAFTLSISLGNILALMGRGSGLAASVLDVYYEFLTRAAR